MLGEVTEVLDKGIELEKDEGKKQELETLKKERLDAFEAKVNQLAIWEDIEVRKSSYRTKFVDGALMSNPVTTSGYLAYKLGKWIYEKATEGDETEIPLSPFPIKQPEVYHFHPVAFVEQMKKMFDVITLEKAKEIAVKVSAGYEGNRDFSNLADNFDGQGMSWGIIQYNFGQNTLGPLLLKMKSKNEQKFNECFVNSNDLNSLNAALAGSTQDQKDWAIDMQNNHKSRWKDIFDSLADVKEFQKIQIEGAESYDNQALRIIEWMREKQPDIMQNIELSTFVALHDLAVQQWTINNAKDAIVAKCNSNPPQNQEEFIRIVVEERGATANTEYRADCISRRLGILNKQATKITHSGHTRERENKNFELIIKGYICDL